MGSKPDKVIQPTPPAPPDWGQTMKDYIKNYPQYIQAITQGMPEVARAQYGIGQELYPQTTALQEELASQALAGSKEEAPAWYKAQAANYLKGLLGENVRSGLGADFYTTGMLGQMKNWQDYYRNLGLTLTGRLPLTTPATMAPYVQGLTPGQVGNFNQQGYGSYANAWSQAPWTTQDKGGGLGWSWGGMTTGLIGGAVAGSEIYPGWGTLIGGALGAVGGGLTG